MRYLIDGYNLLYALGLARPKSGRSVWDHGRRQLLDWLADRHGKTTSDVIVIFDAQNAFGGLIEERYRGLRVVRDRGRTADDLIEDMLKVEHLPHLLTVVSNDGRVRDAATRHGCLVNRCEEYVDALMNPPKSSTDTKPDENEKPARPTPEETETWMKAFGG